MEYRKKLETHLVIMWMIDFIRYFPVDKKQYVINILHYQVSYHRSMWKKQMSSIIHF